MILVRRYDLTSFFTSYRHSPRQTGLQVTELNFFEMENRTDESWSWSLFLSREMQHMLYDTVTDDLAMRLKMDDAVRAIQALPVLVVLPKLGYHINLKYYVSSECHGCEKHSGAPQTLNVVIGWWQWLQVCVALFCTGESRQSWCFIMSEPRGTHSRLRIAYMPSRPVLPYTTRARVAGSLTFILTTSLAVRM